ncbi:MAG: hypothetical protein AAF724_22955 [Pseudomonadota bacterium]
MTISQSRKEQLLRRAIALAMEARQRGDHAFGALLAEAAVVHEGFWRGPEASSIQ